jgi:hypothetical protein
MPIEDPRTYWISQNFRLSDFLGNHSVYARGFANPYEGNDFSMGNAEALCLNGLERLLERFGPLSIAYGYISPEFSRRTVTYQDPNKPSHHRWDLGAAADICIHSWVDHRHTQDTLPLANLFMDWNTSTSPAALAHEIDQMGIPYSRLITYSESPFLCLAIAEHELLDEMQPRKAFYENRYEGTARVKPDYRQLSNERARARAYADLQEQGLPADWRGAGHPTYHGGGLRQFQHTKVSKYTTALDWLFNLKSISEGHKNAPVLTSDPVLDSFAAAGMVYDHIIDHLNVKRLSILGGFVARNHPDFDPDADWSKARWITLELGAPQGAFIDGFEMDISGCLPDGIDVSVTELGARITLPVGEVLEGLIPYNQ